MLMTVGRRRAMYHRDPAFLLSDRGGSAPSAIDPRREPAWFRIACGSVGGVLGLLLAGALAAVTPWLS